MPHATHEDDLATLAPEPRARLVQVQAMVERLVPDAQRCSFRHGAPLPLELIGRVAVALADAHGRKHDATKAQ